MDFADLESALGTRDACCRTKHSKTTSCHRWWKRTAIKPSSLAIQYTKGLSKCAKHILKLLQEQTTKLQWQKTNKGAKVVKLMCLMSSVHWTSWGSPAACDRW